jgi:2-polyprenyl-3-methyl-5-hydroxy-6-metoxy-1,4-benzoquinol methylase
LQLIDLQGMIHYAQCPACGSENITELFKAADHTVSNQQFAIWHCSSCTLRFTQDVPGQDDIGPYYQSEKYISHSDTKKSLVNTLYHFVRKKTLQSKKNLVTQQTGLLKGIMLDIGCGTGAFLNTMKMAGWGITGLEPDAIARSKAAELYNLHPESPEKLFTLKEGSFNAITMWHVLEHVHDLHGYMKQLHKILSASGRLFIAVPNYTSYEATVYRQNWASWDVPRHLYHFSPQAMKALLLQHGFVLKAIKPMWFDSFYISMLSEQYKNRKGNIFMAFIRGLQSNLKAWRSKEKCSSIIYIVSKA